MWTNQLRISSVRIANNNITMEISSIMHKQTLYIIVLSDIHSKKDIIPRFDYYLVGLGKTLPLIPSEIKELKVATLKILYTIKSKNLLRGEL